MKCALLMCGEFAVPKGISSSHALSRKVHILNSICITNISGMTD